MNFDITYNPEINCLIGKVTGDLDIDTVKEYVRKISSMAEKHDCKRFINDLREANIRLSIANFYNAPNLVSGKVFDRTWERAILVKKKTDKLSFFETTSLNQGFHVKVFESFDEALEWLNK